MGKLTIAVVTKPFAFEGKPRMDHAEIGIANLKKVVDTLVIIPNERLMQYASRIPMVEAFRHADDVLRQGIQGISDLIVTPHSSTSTLPTCAPSCATAASLTWASAEARAKSALLKP